MIEYEYAHTNQLQRVTRLMSDGAIRSRRFGRAARVALLGGVFIPNPAGPTAAPPIPAALRRIEAR